MTTYQQLFFNVFLLINLINQQNTWLPKGHWWQPYRTWQHFGRGNAPGFLLNMQIQEHGGWRKWMQREGWRRYICDSLVQSRSSFHQLTIKRLNHAIDQHGANDFTRFSLLSLVDWIWLLLWSVQTAVCSPCGLEGKPGLANWWGALKVLCSTGTYKWLQAGGHIDALIDYSPFFSLHAPTLLPTSLALRGEVARIYITLSLSTIRTLVTAGGTAVFNHFWTLPSQQQKWSTSGLVWRESRINLFRLWRGAPVIA